MRLPPNNQWVQTNRSDILGSLLGSFNINLTQNLGKLKATRMITNISGLPGTPVGFKFYFGGTSINGMYAIAGNKIYVAPTIIQGISPSSLFAADTQTNSPTTLNSLYSDIEVFNGSIYVTATVGAQALLWKNFSNSWSSNSTPLISQTKTHMLCTFPLLQRMYISNGDSAIYSIDTTDTIATSSVNTLAPFAANNLSVSVMRAGSNRIWIGTIANAGKGYMFEWDGAATQFTRSYLLQAQGVLACVVKDDIPYIVDTNGRLLAYNGSAFVEIARFPYFNKIPTNILHTQNDRCIHPNGMSVVNGKINILINNLLGDSVGSINEFLPSGVWEYDETLGLYHKYSFSYTPLQTTTVTDYGQNRIATAGAIAEVKLTDGSATANGSFVAGSTIYANDGTTSSVICYDDLFELASTSTQRGAYIVTPEIYSQNITENWQAIYPYYKRFTDAANKIIVKYRNFNIPSVEVSIVWLNATTFTSIGDLSNYIKGDEIEITQGTGGGFCAHITDIHYINSTTYSVTIDETIPGVTTGIAKARFQKWIKLLPEINDITSQSKRLGLSNPAVSRWIQFKIFMIFKGGDELDGAEIVNKVNQPIT